MSPSAAVSDIRRLQRSYASVLAETTTRFEVIFRLESPRPRSRVSTTTLVAFAVAVDVVELNTVASSAPSLLAHIHVVEGPRRL